MKQITISLRTAVEINEGIEKIRKEAENGEYKTILFHVYSGQEEPEAITEVTSRISREFPGCPLVGTLSAGEIMGGTIPEKGIVLSALFFTCTTVRVLRKDHVKGRETEAGRELAGEINTIPELKAVELLLPGTALQTRLFFEELNGIRREAVVYGGYSGGHQLEQSEHFIFNDRGIDEDAVYAVCYSGKDFHINVDKSAGWQQLGMPFKVTKADEGRLIEIDGAPAVEVYEKYLQIGRDDHFAEETFEFPLIASMDGEELLRHTITVEPDGTLDMAGYVVEGMDIFLSYGNPEEIVKNVNRRLKEVADFHPQAILVFSCSVRKSFWESFAEIEVKPFEDIAATSGFYTWGEVKRNPGSGKLYEYNITMLSVAMREGEARPLDRTYRVDDSVLKGQASLLKRLSKLVAATTGELQKAYINLSILNEKLEVMADYDALTGMFNRRKIEDKLHEHMAAAAEKGGIVGMIMMDVDHFKEVNDTYGHGIGDEVLSTLGKLCIKTVKEFGGDLGRWGGEEIVISLPGCGQDRTFAFAEELRHKVEAATFPCVGGLTVSLGVSETNGKEELRDVYHRIDKAMYRSKKKGRNCTTIYSCKE